MNNVSHKFLDGSDRAMPSGARALGAADAHEWLEVTLKLRRKEELPLIEGRPPTTRTYAQLAEEHGASTEDIDQITRVCEQLGLEIIKVNPAARSARIGGQVSTMEEVFHVKLFRYSHERGNYRGRTGVLHVPAELKDIIVGVFGLDNRPVVKDRRRPANVPVVHASPRAGRRAWFFPAELANIYDFPPGDGTGQSIGLLEFGGGYFPADLQAFCQAAGTPVPEVIPISVGHTPTNLKDGAEGEVMLDIEVIAGICPKAKIPVYFSMFSEQGWIDGLDAVIHDQVNQPSVLSISWGQPEDDRAGLSLGAIDAINETLKDAALLGITVCVASGDDGSDDQVGDGRAHVDFPSGSPYVLAVGGTSLRVRSGKTAEVAWKDGDGLRQDGGGSTGGGVSVHFERPPWQAIIVESINPGAIIGRCVPDVAADASGHTGYIVFVDGNGQISGGTSASAPLWAALITRIITRINAALGKGMRVGYLTPILYQAAPDGGAIGVTTCRDITVGDNTTATIGGYTSTPGYDAVTGWGSPIGTKLLSTLQSILR